jgi:hypothetical protein
MPIRTQKRRGQQSLDHGSDSGNEEAIPLLLCPLLASNTLKPTRETRTVVAVPSPSNALKPLLLTLILIWGTGSQQAMWPIYEYLMKFKF